jgi:hypothetical protein
MPHFLAMPRTTTPGRSRGSERDGSYAPQFTRRTRGMAHTATDDRLDAKSGILGKTVPDPVSLVRDPLGNGPFLILY